MPPAFACTTLYVVGGMYGTAWLEGGGASRDPSRIVQGCGAGLVAIRRDGDSLAFAAPPLLRSGPVDEADAQAIGALTYRLAHHEVELIPDVAACLDEA